MSLFGIHEKFDPIWWLDYHKTVDMFALYTRLNSTGRETFVESVYWIPDGTGDLDAEYDDLTGDGVPVGKGSIAVSTLGPSTGGYCYLSFFREEHHARIAAHLKDNPWAVSIAALLLAEPGVRSPGNFKLTLGPRVTDKGLAFIQAHVVPESGGVPINYLLPHLTGLLRVGASTDLGALLNSQAQDPIAARPTVYPSIPVRGGPGIELSFNVFARIGKDQVKYPNVTFNVMSEPTFMILLGTFESVQLEGATFNIQVSTGAANSLACAISAPESDLISDLSWLAAPVNTFIYGSDQGFVNGVFSLPDLHPFEKELRYPNNTGNPIPVFRFGFTGVAAGFATVKGMIKVRVRGQFALGHLRIGGPSSKVTRDNHNLVAASLPSYSDCRTHRDGDDVDDGPDSGTTRHSPSKSNTSATRQ